VEVSSAIRSSITTISESGGGYYALDDSGCGVCSIRVCGCSVGDGGSGVSDWGLDGYLVGVSV
jgi:hypothetical protein